MSNRTIIRSSRANEDLIEIWTYIGQRDVAAADRMLRRIDERIAQLKQHPELGERVPRLQGDLRRITIGNYVAFYQLLDDAVWVVRILHTSRRWEDLI